MPVPLRLRRRIRHGEAPSGSRRDAPYPGPVATTVIAWIMTVAGALVSLDALAAVVVARRAGRRSARRTWLQLAIGVAGLALGVPLLVTS
jgi:threonine/homoserine/homoserine lactone efflux protein